MAISAPKPDTIVKLRHERRTTTIRSTVSDSSVVDGDHQHKHHYHENLSDRLLARWLSERIGFNGARAFVEDAGARVVLETLKEDVMHWERGRGWYVSDGLRNAAGHLRVQVRARLGRKV